MDTTSRSFEYVEKQWKANNGELALKVEIDTMKKSQERRTNNNAATLTQKLNGFWFRVFLFTLRTMFTNYYAWWQALCCFGLQTVPFLEHSLENSFFLENQFNFLFEKLMYSLLLHASPKIITDLCLYVSTADSPFIHFGLLAFVH